MIIKRNHERYISSMKFAPLMIWKEIFKKSDNNMIQVGKRLSIELVYGVSLFSLRYFKVDAATPYSSDKFIAATSLNALRSIAI